MQRWLQGWQKSLTPDPNDSAHAGHGGQHDLPPTTLAALKAASPAVFDPTAVSILLGHLQNCVDSSRLESTGGAYPPARSLADQMTKARDDQLQRLSRLAG
jgi:uncharacterized protein (DUF305 family)